MHEAEALQSVLQLGASAFDEPPRAPPGVPRLRAVFVVHGMGQQLRFETLDAVSNGLHREDIRRHGEAGKRKAVPRSVQFGGERLERIEMRLRSDNGHEQEVHIYEAYWSPLIEGAVNLRAVVSFLIGAGINGVKKAGGAFRRRVFTDVRDTHVPVRTLIYLIVALLTVVTLIIINTAVVAVPAARSPFSTPPAWLSDALFKDFTYVFNATAIVLELFAISIAISLLLSHFRKYFSTPFMLKLRHWLALVLAFASLTLFVLALFAIVATGVAVPILFALHATADSPIATLIPIWVRSVGACTPTVTIALAVLIAGVGGLFYFISPILRGCIRQWKEEEGDEKEKRTSRWMTSVVFATFVGLIYGVVHLTLMILNAAPADGPSRWQVIAFEAPVWGVLFVVGLTVRGFLVQYVGDIAAYIESHTVDRFHRLRTDIKAKVLKTAEAIYGQKSDKENFDYEEIVVVGHSLGSVIAYDTLNRLLLDDSPPTGAGRNWNVIQRTRLFLTFGSPLDKTAFIFSTQSKKRSMTDAREALAAAVQPLIDSRDVRSRIRWLNIFSPWDIISGRLNFYDDPDRKTLPVENVSDPEAVILLGAHTEYWRNWLLFERLYSSVNPGNAVMPGQAKGPDSQAVEELQKQAAARFEKQLKWLDEKEERSVILRRPPGAPDNRAEVQGGILRAYEDFTHGCLLLMAFDNRGAAAAFLDELIPQVTKDEDKHKLSQGEVVVNAAFTYEGLRATGLTEDQLACFPQEFREGMEARASVLGDFRTNHPRRWRLPVRNWPDPPGKEPQFVELSAVHLIVQLRIRCDGNEIDDPTNRDHPLHSTIEELSNGSNGVRLLSVQPMRRYLNDAHKAIEHFGFADGDGQPVIDPAVAAAIYKTYKDNLVQLGELLLGYANEADPAPDPATGGERHEWLHNGTFLVIRKLKQDVAALEQAVSDAKKATGLSRDLLLAKMMGRKQNSDPLVPPYTGNDFVFPPDERGSLCPFHAHIRRANPRKVDDPKNAEPPGRRTPRIMRRGMSYGPRYNLDDKNDPVNAQERGMVFMAYNASTAEQFEVVQRWLSGGNSAGGYSGQSDPFMGVAENGQQRFFRFENNGKVESISLDGSTTPLADPKPFVRLEWGGYLFTPSLTALRKLRDVAASEATRTVPVWSAQKGLKEIEPLKKLEEEIKALKKLEQEKATDQAITAWKSLLEDPEARENFISASVWAAIREHHGGVLRTPYGVLVANYDLVMDVFNNKGDYYSVRGYHDRMVQSMGEIYLGLDKLTEGGRYDQQATATNAAIYAITQDDAFGKARGFAKSVLATFIDGTRSLAKRVGEKRWELNLDVRELSDAVLALLCQEWFGLPKKDGEVVPGSSRWDWDSSKDKPLYPGNFTAPSRYIFQPRPGETAEHFGRLYGGTLTKAFIRLVRNHRDNGSVPTAPIAAAIFNAFPAHKDDVQVARTLVGALMGFLPTVDGNLRLSLIEWLRDNTFWSIRAALAGRELLTCADAEKELLAPLVKAMQLRPSPELVWRTAAQDHTIGNVEVKTGDLIVVSIVSATQQRLEHGVDDVLPIFGGDRRYPPHPTHACPGYKMGMGVLLGILSALLEVKQSMRASPAPLAFTFEGDVS